MNLPVDEIDRNPKTRRTRALGTAIVELALSIALIVSIVVVLAVAGASVALAQRGDLMIMEESGPNISSALIVAGIVLVMGLLTILAIRDASPTRGRGHHAPRRTSRR